MPATFLDAIVGARPNMIKMAPLARALAEDGTFRLRLIHTGQHYDDRMSHSFFRELGLPEPEINLEVGPGHQGAQTARILERYEQVLLAAQRPRGVIVIGDVNSTMACSLAAAKLGVPIAHIEAGLRSGDRSMPEEVNRIVTDTLSELLFVSDPEGLIHLAREGHDPDQLRYVGNIVMDTYFRELPAASSSTILHELGLQPQKYLYLTLHRPSNVDDPAVLARLMRVFVEIAREIPLVFSIHPRTRERLKTIDPSVPTDGSFRWIEPLGYQENLAMILGAKAVLTDSGGIQAETTMANVPCLTLRENTERPITVSLGTSELVGNEPERIREAWERVRAGKWKQAAAIPLWDGRTAERIVGELRRSWG